MLRLFSQRPPPKQLTAKRESELSVNAKFAKTMVKLKRDYDRGLQWKANKEQKSPEDFGFIDENDVAFHDRLYRQQYETYRHYLYQPESKTGILLNKLFNGAVVDTVNVPSKWPAGDYVIKVRIAALDQAPSNERFVEYGRIGESSRSGELELLGCINVTGTMEQPQTLEIPISVTQTHSRSFGFRQRQHNSRQAARTAFLQSQTKTKVGPPASLWIDWIEIEGPIYSQWPPRGVSEIFFKGTNWWKQPDEDAYAREIIEEVCDARLPHQESIQSIH